MGNKLFCLQKPLFLKTPAMKEIRLSLAFGLPMIISYAGVLSHSSYYTPCDTESESYRWAYVYWIYSIINMILSCTIVPFCICQAEKMQKEKDHISEKKWEKAKMFLKLVLLLGTFIVYFGICYAYGTGEKCSHLTKVILSFIIIFPIVFTIIFSWNVYKAIKKKKEGRNIDEKNDALLNNEEEAPQKNALLNNEDDPNKNNL